MDTVDGYPLLIDLNERYAIVGEFAVWNPKSPMNDANHGFKEQLYGMTIEVIHRKVVVSKTLSTRIASSKPIRSLLEGLAGCPQPAIKVSIQWRKVKVRHPGTKLFIAFNPRLCG